MSEKTEKATPYKLQKAKEKGQVSQSNELTRCLSFLVLLAMLTALWAQQCATFQILLRHLLFLAAQMQFSLDNCHHMYHIILHQIIHLWLPFALAGGLAVILATMAQTGIVGSFTPLRPDFKRLRVQGFKKLFSKKIGFELVKNMVQLSLGLVFLCSVLQHHLPKILHLIVTPVAQYPQLMMCFLLKLMFQLSLLLLLFALLDKGYVRWNYAKDQRMSQQEVKEEYKHREGDPKIKFKIKQLQRQLREKTASLKHVKTADVIITNPTHLAVALKYEHVSMPAPQVVCKARGDLVKRVKQLAMNYSVPIVENKELAQLLYSKVELNQWINKELYPAAASIFRHVYSMKGES